MKVLVDLLVDDLPVTLEIDHDDYTNGYDAYALRLTELIYAARDTIKVAQENGAKVRSQPAPVGRHIDGGSVTSEVFDVTVIRHTFDGGKHRFKLCGGKWQKFGVPVYPEVICNANLQDMIFNSRLGDTSVTGFVATTALRNGKPYKVVKVEENEHFSAANTTS